MNTSKVQKIVAKEIARYKRYYDGENKKCRSLADQAYMRQYYINMLSNYEDVALKVVYAIQVVSQLERIVAPVHRCSSEYCSDVDSDLILQIYKSPPVMPAPGGFLMYVFYCRKYSDCRLSAAKLSHALQTVINQKADFNNSPRLLCGVTFCDAEPNYYLLYVAWENDVIVAKNRRENRGKSNI